MICAPTVVEATVVGSCPPTNCHWQKSPQDISQTHRSFIEAGSVSAGFFPANSKPTPPNKKRLPELSVHPTAPYRAPGVLVKGLGIDVGTVVGNCPYCGAEGTAIPAVFLPSIQ